MDPFPLAPLVFLTVVAGLGVAGILALAGRGAPDPAGRRADAVYLFTVLAVTLFLALFSAVGAVRGALTLALPGTAVWAVTGGSSLGWHAVPAGPSAVLSPWAAGPPPRAVVYGPLTVGPDPLPTTIALGVLALAAGLAYRWHARHARRLIAEPGFTGSAASRVYRAYLNLVCAGALVVLVFASVPLVLGLVRVVGAVVTGGFGPGPGGMGRGLARSISAGLLAAGAFAIFRAHWVRRGRGRPPPRPPPPESAQGARDQSFARRR